MALRRRSTDFQQLFEQLTPDDVTCLERLLPVWEGPGAEHYAADFAHAQAQLEQDETPELPPKRQLQLHEAVIHILSTFTEEQDLENQILHRMKTGMMLYDRQLYRQALVEFDRARQLAIKYAQIYYLPRLDAIIQSSLGFMAVHDDHSRNDLERVDYKFAEHQLEILAGLEADVRSFAVSISSFWAKFRGIAENPVQQRKQLIRLFEPLKDIDFKQGMFERTSSGYTDYLNNISKLAFLETNYRRAHDLSQQQIDICFSRPQPWPRWQSAEIMYSCMNLVMMKGLIATEDELLQFHDQVEDIMQRGKLRPGEREQLKHELYLRSVQFYMLRGHPQKGHQMHRRLLDNVKEREKPYINYEYLDLFVGNLFALEGDHRTALRKLSVYQTMPTKERLEVICIASIIQVYCALALEDASASELHVRRAVKLLKPMSEDRYLLAIRDALQRKPPESAEQLLVLLDRLSHAYAPGFYVERVNTLLPLAILSGQAYDPDAFKRQAPEPA